MKAVLKKYLNRYFIDAMGAMALGLFASLLIGTIFGTLGKYVNGASIDNATLKSLAEVFNVIANYAKAATGMAIGAAIAYKLGAHPLVMFSCAAVGAMSNAMGAIISRDSSAILKWAATASDGSHALVTNTKLEILGDIYTAMTDFWYSEGAIMPGDSGTNYDIFTGGHALFTVDVVWHYDSGLTMLHNMSDGYGIIPMPKFDEDQESYITGVQDAYNVLSIMECGEGQDFAMISAVLEKMALESYYGVRPYYVENILKLRNMDEESSACFNYVIDGMCFDFCDVYCAGIGWVRNSLWRSPFASNSSFETNWANYSKKNNNLIKTFDTWLATQ